ncbi:hypothetical protein QR680_007307 [Steinernema hermaphroditum]|uniref:DNA repair protein REV1 n=1 Tax=Steinernema hermaphroditum TaxID=289476 RepID=A0AA39ICU1_9BILA|nr:hypothetical protein QR680_007307 [Steinernema hermaphroditum]
MATPSTSLGASDSPSTSRAGQKRRWEDQSHRGGYESFAQYMREKNRKLNEQINVGSVKSDLFKGISIYVNGLTDPPALELRHLIVQHGGEYHTYYFYEKTTYTIASNLASSKASKLRKNEKVLRPSWITDSIREGKLKPEEDYLLLGNENEPDSSSNALLEGAKNPNFLSEFYSRSRLHLISTMAQEMRQWVQKLRSDGEPMEYESRRRLEHLVDQNFTELKSSYYGHFDFDCFFVSVALRKRPDLIGKPVAITHARTNSSGPGYSELASCSYEARKYGVKNGMLMRDALRHCPQLVCLPYEFDDYRATSMAIYQIVAGYTHDMRAISCDEMYVDLSAIARDKQITDIMGIVMQMRKDINAATGCPVSVGIGPNLLLARLATKKAKPNGQYMVENDPYAIENFMRDVKVADLPGVGYSVLSKLDTLNRVVETCADLSRIKVETLKKLIGEKIGKQLHDQSRGIDYTQLIDNRLRQSVSCDINYGIRLTTSEEFSNFIKTVADELYSKLKAAEMDAQSITLKLLIRSPDAPVNPAKFMGCGRCDAHTKSVQLANPFCDPVVIHREVMMLYEALKPPIADIRGIGVQLTKLCRKSAASIALQKRKDFFVKRKRNINWDFLLPKVPEKKIELPIREKFDVPSGLKKCLKREVLRDIVETSIEKVVDRKTTNAVLEYFYYRVLLSDVATTRNDYEFLENAVFDRAKSDSWLCLIGHLKEQVNRIACEKYGAKIIGSFDKTF